MLTLLIGVIAAVGYGSANFLAGIASRHVPPKFLAFGSQLACLAFLLLVLLAFGGHLSFAALGWGALTGIFALVGMVLLYRAMSAGSIGLITPVNGAVSASVQVLFGLLLGETLTTLAWVGIACAVAAVVLIAPRSAADVSQITRAGRTPIMLSTISGAFFAAGFVCLSRTESAAGVWPLLAQRVVIVALLLPNAIDSPSNRGDWRRALPLMLGLGAALVTADACFLFLSRDNGLTVAAPLISLAPVIVVLLARFGLQERWTRRQAVGLSLSLSSALTIALR